MTITQTIELSPRGERYQQRVRPSLSIEAAGDELARVALAGEIPTEPPVWHLHSCAQRAALCLCIGVVLLVLTSHHREADVAMQTVTTEQVATAQEALGELAGGAREGLLALSVASGLGVVHEVMGAEVGPKGRHDPIARRCATAPRTARSRWAVGRWTSSARGCAPRTAAVPLATYRHFAERDPLTRSVLVRMLPGVSTRRFARTGEPLGQRARRTRPPR